MLWKSLHSNAFGQVARLVDIPVQLHGNVIAQQLEWNRAQDGHERIISRVDFDGVVRNAGHLLVPFGDHSDDFASARLHLLNVGQYFFIVGILRGHDEHGHVFIDEGNGAVFHFRGRVTLGVDIADFFEL